MQGMHHTAVSADSAERNWNRVSNVETEFLLAAMPAGAAKEAKP
jgi:hypothetical protein